MEGTVMSVRKKKPIAKTAVGVRSFTIDRFRWLHGEGSDKSYLFRPEDKKQCCLGFYLEACGLKRADLRHQLPSDCSGPRSDLVPVWLLGRRAFSGRIDSPQSSQLMRVNDSESWTDEERETRIIEIFKRKGVKVKFVGKYDGFRPSEYDDTADD